MNGEDIKVGAKLKMADLKNGRVVDVVVQEPPNPKVVVMQEGNGFKRWLVSPDFLSPR